MLAVTGCIVLQAFFNISVSQNNIFHDFTRHWSETERHVFSRVLLLALLKTGTMLVSFQSTGSQPLWIPKTSQKSSREALQCHQLALWGIWMNTIRPHRFVGIQLEQQIPQKFRIHWELIILTLTVLQLRVLRPSWSILHVEDRGNECMKSPCLDFILCLCVHTCIFFCVFPCIWLMNELFLILTWISSNFLCNLSKKRVSYYIYYIWRRPAP